MSAQFQSSTISPPAARDAVLFLRWSGHFELRPQAEALLGILGARTALTDYLAVILTRLSRAAPMLSAWAEEGIELYGMSRLAAGLADNPQILSDLSGACEPPVANVESDFRGQASSHYLYMSWVVRDPVRASARPWFNTLRCWLLVKSLARSAAKRKFVLDDHIRNACVRLREASEENDQPRWLDLIDGLAGPTGWFRLQARLGSASGSHLVSRFPELKGRDLAFYGHLGCIAKDEAKPIAGTADVATAPSFERVFDIPELPQPQVAVDGEDEQAGYEPLSLREDEEEDEELGVCLAPVDSTQGPAAQELTGRYIQLLSGADARYLTWDWYALTPPEAVALVRLIDRSLGVADAEAVQGTGLVASLAWVALRCGRSLGLVERLLLTGTRVPISNDWQADLNLGVLVRLPPRRAGHWSPNAEHLEHIRPAADSIQVTLDQRALNCLRHARDQTPGAVTLGDLWPATAATPLRAEFRRWIATEPALRRVTQGMLSQHFGRVVFEDTDDHVLARLLGSLPASGLPASTAYTAYSAEQIPGALIRQPLEPDGSNVAGSLLDPMAGFLQSGFQNVFRAVGQAAAGTSIIEYHNALTHYWDAVLLAATGVRPFGGRWARYVDVDEQQQFVVIDDKPGVAGSRTRLVPLPSGLLQVFKRSYLDGHVPALQSWLRQSGVDAVGPSSGSDPLEGHDFLFLLRRDGGNLVPTAVAEGQPAAGYMPEWPLPRRTYRHWLRTQLHRAGADVEVVDSMFGHQDGATATHGDYSMRVWCADSVQIRPVLDLVFDSLRIQLPPQLQSFDHFHRLQLGTPDQRPPIWPAAPALEAVARTRWLLHLKAARSAADILTLNLRPPAPTPVSNPAPTRGRLPLSEMASRLGAIEKAEVLDRLGCQLMLTPKGLPATLGALRYGFFLRLIDRAWEVSGLRPPLKRRFLFRPRDDSPFRHSAAGALELRARLVECFGVSVKSLQPSKMTLTDATWIAVIDLALSSRCADLALHQVLLTRSRFRLVRLAARNYLEWNPAGQVEEVDTAVQRLRITPLCERALAVLLASRRTGVSADTEPPVRFRQLCSILSNAEVAAVSFAQVQSRLKDLIEQCNAIELPGLVAAQLAGRVRSSSLHWGDWLALRTGRRRDLRGGTFVVQTEAEQKAAKRGASLGVAFGSTRMPPPATNIAARPAGLKGTDGSMFFSQPQAREFFRAARRALARTQGAGTEPGQKGRRASEASFRRDIRRRLEQLAADWSGIASTACWALVRWAASMLERENTRELLRLSTVSRYFAALSPRFEAMAVDVDLLAMDPEDIEDFYKGVVEFKDRSRRLYPAERLREFHRYAERELGLPAIDWSEIAPHEERQLSSPGLLDENNFRLLVLSLARTPLLEPEERPAAQVLAILAFRAGLRGSEATGLLVDDLHLDDAVAWVSVEKNRLRDLKSFSARRTVPMPHLRPLELRLLSRAVADAQRIARGHESPHYLFADPVRQSAMLDIGHIKRTVNAEIKAVSSQDHLSIHHLRHSFATRLSFELDSRLHFGADAAGPTRMPWAQVDWESSSVKTRTLLGLSQDPTRSSRRSAWVLCRLLGHAHPRTTFVSYVHTLGDLAEHLAFAPAVIDWKAARGGGGLGLDDLPLARLPARQDRPEAQDLAAVHVLSMICDLNAGVPAGLLTSRYPVRLAQATRLARLLTQVENRLGDDALGESDAGTATGPPSAPAVGPSRSSRKIPATRAGLMGHILQSHLPRLRQALGHLYTQPRPAELATMSISESDFVGMFGSRRNISMVREAQFRLVAFVASAMNIPDSRLRLAVPSDLRRVVAERAIASGWLQRLPDGTLAPGRPGMRLIPAIAPDRVLLDGERVHHRVVLSLGHGEGAPVQNRWEFALMLVAAVPLLDIVADPD